MILCVRVKLIFRRNHINYKFYRICHQKTQTKFNWIILSLPNNIRVYTVNLDVMSKRIFIHVSNFERLHDYIE